MRSLELRVAVYVQIILIQYRVPGTGTWYPFYVPKGSEDGKVLMKLDGTGWKMETDCPYTSNP